MNPSGFADDVEPIPVRHDPEPVPDNVRPLRPSRRGFTVGNRSDDDVLLSVLPEDETPIVGPEHDTATRGGVPAPRLARHVIELANGEQVGVAVSGKGVPLVVIHGFSAEGFLYAQTLSRLVSMGFKVVAIDTANHGSTQGLPAGGANFEAYTRLLGDALDHLGIDRAFLAGHSMGGRIVTQLAAADPQRALGVLLIDAIVGDTWDQLVSVGRVFPPLMGGVVVALAADSLGTVQVFKDPRQAAKLIRLGLPTYSGHIRRPWRMLGPAVSILRSRGSRWMLQRLRAEGVPVVAIHGDRDLAVPFSTAESAARRSGGQVVRIKGGTHSWILKDPETLPAVMAELLQGPIGDAYRKAVDGAGLDPATATIDEIEAAMYAPDAAILDLTPPLEFARVATRRRRPRFAYEIRDSTE